MVAAERSPKVLIIGGGIIGDERSICENCIMCHSPSFIILIHSYLHMYHTKVVVLYCQGRSLKFWVGNLKLNRIKVNLKEHQVIIKLWLKVLRLEKQWRSESELNR